MTSTTIDRRNTYESSLIETRLNNLLVHCFFVTLVNCKNQNKIPHSRLTAVII